MVQGKGRDDGFIVEVLKSVFGSQKEIAHVIGRSQGFVARLKKDVSDPEKRSWSQSQIAAVIAALAKKSPPIILIPEDWALDKAKFAARIHAQGIKKQGTGSEEQDALPQNGELPPIDLKLFEGRFIRLFIQPLPTGLKKLAVHLSDVWIFPGKTYEQCRIEFRSFRNDLKVAGQLKNPKFRGLKPCGYLQVVGRTLEMVVKYGSDIPKSLYLGPYPNAHHVAWFLMTNLDIKFRNRQVCATPMLFIRVKKGERFALDALEPGTRLFRLLRKFFKGLTEYRDKSFEFLLLSPYDASVEGITDALGELKRKR